MFKIIGADEKEYGPISADQIRQWIAEGRANGQTMACAEGTHDWKPLEQFPEFGYTVESVPPLPVAAVPATPMTREELLARDYSLDIFSCFTRAWALVKSNFGVLFVTALLFTALNIAASWTIGLLFMAAGFNRLPPDTRIYLGPVTLIFGLLIIAPLMGGFYNVYISIMRGRLAQASDIFFGFRSFQDLFLGGLIPGIFSTLCMIPYDLANAKLDPLWDRLLENSETINKSEVISQLLAGYSSSLPILLVSMIPVTYLAVNWQFVLPLIVDKKMDFWAALGTSWKMVHKHWFALFGLVVLIGLLNVAGLCMCIVGILFTFPLGIAALMYAYEDIFGRQNA